eukprot:TRINITY_DN555_c1_g1_i1.p1 TRINITY_DN555_c1_g1~~TRINITY_DN555_c1_g1_i1.p1  ORF type:complete len:357 (-),score=30.80 TRINITY_DN555_c1_g1_i1:290-1360(-)
MMDVMQSCGGVSCDILLARVLYVFHMLSVPCWVAASARALWKQRDVKAMYGPSKVVGPTLPTKCEYFSIRLLAVYVIMDFLRGIDACFDSTDGVCRAIWGFAPWWWRCFTWVTRDLALLGAIGYNLSFNLGWTFEALQWAPPRTLQRLMHGTLGTALCGVAAAFWALMASNRQSWQAWAVLFVVGLNGVWAWTNLVLLRDVVPVLESSLKASKAVPAWVRAVVEEVRLTAKLVLTADVAIMIAFPLLAFERVVLKDASNKVFFPGAGFNEWVGNSVPPLLMDRPNGVLLNPALEVVEMLIGWLQFVYVMRIGSASIATRIPCLSNVDSAEAEYIDEASLGTLVRSSVFGCVDKKRL